MTTTLFDLINSLDASDIIRECAVVDPENAANYCDLISEIKDIVPVRGTMEIVIRKCVYPVNDEEYIDVSGREFGDPELWAIEFMDWSEWMGCTYVVEGAELTDAQIVAECLNEMTWMGWSAKEAREASDSLLRSVDEALDEVSEESE